MEYTTLTNLKSYLRITDSSRNTELTSLIATATQLVDIELWYNLTLNNALQVVVNGMGKNRVVLPQKVNSVSKIEVRDSGNSTWSEIAVDFLDGLVLYVLQNISPGVKNVRVTCSRGYDSVPADFERWFISYCAQLLQKQDQDTEGQIHNKKLDGLSITYFGPSDFAGNDEGLVNFRRLITHYKSFSFSSSPL